MLNQPWLPVERCKLAVSSLLRCEGWVVVIKNARYEANSYTKYVNRWWKSVSSPTRVASWRIALECCRLLLIRTWQVIGGIRIVSAFKSKLSRHKEPWVHPWELRKKKKCLLGWFHSECFMFLKKEALFINVEKKFVWVFKVCENIKCTFFFLSPHFLPPFSDWKIKWSPHHFKPVFTVTIWLLFSKEQSYALPFLIHLAVRHSVIRQNEDFPHNEAHAKSDIIQSGPFSSAFVLCFLLLFWTFLWFQWRLKNLKWHNSVASVWRWGCNPNGFSAEKSLKTHTHLNLALGATGFKPQR